MVKSDDNESFITTHDGEVNSGLKNVSNDVNDDNLEDDKSGKHTSKKCIQIAECKSNGREEISGKKEKENVFNK